MSVRSAMHFDGRIEVLSPRCTAQVRVRYGETDAMGYVYYGNYPLYFEVGRNELMRMLGISYVGLEGSGIMMPAVDMRIAYGVPAHYDDLLDVHTAISSLRGASLEFAYRIDRHETSEVVVRGATCMAFVDAASRRAVRIPQFVVDAVRLFQDGLQ